MLLLLRQHKADWHKISSHNWHSVGWHSYHHIRKAPIVVGVFLCTAHSQQHRVDGLKALWLPHRCVTCCWLAMAWCR